VLRAKAGDNVALTICAADTCRACRDGRTAASRADARLSRHARPRQDTLTQVIQRCTRSSLARRRLSRLLAPERCSSHRDEIGGQRDALPSRSTARTRPPIRPFGRGIGQQALERYEAALLR